MNSKIIIVVLALALVIVSAKLAMGSLFFSSSDKSAVRDSVVNNAAYQNIMARTSVRAYQQREVAEATVDSLLRAGMAAPSAMDKRPWHFIVVSDKETLARLGKVLPYAGMAAKAPLAIAVCGDMRKAGEGKSQEYWIQDTSAASENILLAAQSMGLGAVWTGVWPIEERCKALAEILDTPDYIVPLNLIVIGYPAQPQKPKDKYTVDNVSYDSYEGD